MRVTTVSVETVKLVQLMKEIGRYPPWNMRNQLSY